MQPKNLDDLFDILKSDPTAEEAAEHDLPTAMARVEALWDAEEGTDAADELDVVTTLIEAYEDRHFPAEVVSPVDAIRFRMSQQGLINRDHDRQRQPGVGGAQRQTYSHPRHDPCLGGRTRRPYYSKEI